MKFQSKGKGVLFGFEVMGETQVKGMILGIRDKVKNLMPIWDKVDAILRKSSKYMFNKRGGSRFKWPPLSKKYRDAKKKLYPGKPLLVAKGDLKRSMINAGGDHILEKHRKHMMFGTKVAYAGYHQSPKRRRTKLKRRPFIYIERKNVGSIVSLMREHCIEGTQSLKSKFARSVVGG